jgi:hypothetical protein
VGVTNQADEWAQATREFLASPEGQNWPGGSNNLTIMGYLLRENGLADAEDKVAALKSVASEMRARGLDVVPAQKMQVDVNASPQEIIEKWKAAYGDDPFKVGEAFRNFFKK